MKLKQIFQNFSLTVLSNLLTLVISTLVILIVPKLIGVYEYGLWQLFIFYSSYVGILHFGWLDGIYLRYGGENYEHLNKGLFKSQFIILLLSQIMISLIVILLSCIFFQYDTKKIFYGVSIIIVIVNLKTFFQFVLQMTNRVAVYAISNFISSIVYVVLLISLIWIGIRDYQQFIFSYIIGQLMSLIYCLFLCKDIVLSKMELNLKVNYVEIKNNVVAGIKLVVSNVAGMLIIGIVRFGIQEGWSVRTFGKVSLVLSVSNLLMVFVGAISLVLFPILRRTGINQINQIYTSLRGILMLIVILGMFSYFPIIVLVPRWLPKYRDALIYMSILFPVAAYQAEFEMLHNTFFKVLRMEKQLMIINIFSLALSLVLTVLSVKILHNLLTTVLVIIIVMAARSIIADHYMHSKGSTIDVIIESVIMLVFMLSTWFFTPMVSITIYVIVVICYLFINFNNIKSDIRFIFNKR